MAQFLEPWERLMSAEELTDAGDTVFVTVCQRGVGTASASTASSSATPSTPFAARR